MKTLLPSAQLTYNASVATEATGSDFMFREGNRSSSPAKTLALLSGFLMAILLLIPNTASAQTTVNTCQGQTVRFNSKLPSNSYQARWLISYDNGYSWYFLSDYSGNYGDNIWYEYYNTPVSYNGYRLQAQYRYYDYYGYSYWADIPDSYFRLSVGTYPAAPTVSNGSRIGSGTVTLSASGAPTGGTYYWYDAYGYYLTQGATYTTPVLTSSRTYYVSTVNAQGCESSTKAVTATINPLPDGAVTSPKIIIYHENFASYASGQDAAGFTTDNYTSGSTIYPHWVTAPSNDFVLSNSAQASGGNFLRTNRSINTTLTRNLNLNNNISTTGYENIKVIWTHRQTYNSTNKPRLYFSTNNGSSWNEVTGWQATTTLDANWNLVNNGNFISLPAEAANAANLSFRWAIPSMPGGTGNFYALDDITITGTPVDGLSTFSWSSLPYGTKPISHSATNPAAYTVDGVKLQWTGLPSTYLTKEGVFNDEYQSPVFAYTFMQEKATSTSGSTTILNLDKLVDDLTFTMIDIDRDYNQFRDRIVVKGYNGTTLVPLSKYKIVHTSYNEVRAGSNIISGTVNGTEVPAASKEGNVTIAFAGAVDRVEIEYYNEESTRNFNGKQGFAIQDISWRKYVPANPMPVELVSFKASLQNSAARLAWSTAMEKDNDKFVVERSQDGKEFKAIGQVKGTGNSQVVQQYSFKDASLQPGTNYYRLRQLDINGTESFSNVAMVEFKPAAAFAPELATLYPTVASDKITIRLEAFSGNTQLQLANATGTVLLKDTCTTDLIEVPVHQLNSGLYLVTVTNGIQKQTLRFIKQ